MPQVRLAELVASLSLATDLGLGLPQEKVTVAMVVAVGAAEAGRETLMFLTKEAVQLVLPGNAVGVAGEGCPPLASLIDRFATASGRFLVM